MRIDDPVWATGMMPSEELGATGQHGGLRRCLKPRRVREWENLEN